MVLIGSRARPRPVKAPAHNDGRTNAATRTTWQIRKKKKKPKRPQVLVAALSHVLSCESSVPKLINNQSVFIQLFPPPERAADAALYGLTHRVVFHIGSVAVSWCFFVEGRKKKSTTPLLDTCSRNNNCDAISQLGHHISASQRCFCLLLTIFKFSSRQK